MKTVEHVKPDWKWASSERSREIDRLLDRQLTFREKLEWLEEAENALAASWSQSRTAIKSQERSPN